MRSRLNYIIIFAIVLFAASTVSAEDSTSWDVLNAEYRGVAPEELLQKYLLEQLRPHFANRLKKVSEADTPEKFRNRQTALRKKLLEINGPFPEKTELNETVMRTVKRDGYRIENVIYESRPGHHITANLYIPDGLTGPAPGVLIPCGHSRNGKAAEAYQSISISLVQHGMVAMCYDPIGQGERHQLLDDLGKPSTQGTGEHTLVGVGAWLVGTGTANYRIWDGIRSLDYLASRPEVDSEKLGCTGNSGGGTMTSYLMAFDLRIKAAAPSCYLTTLERLFDTIGPQDAEQNFPGQVAFGIDHADYIALRAPLPTLMCVATQDFFDIDGAKTTFLESKRLYGMLGHAERMDLIEYNDKHGFSQPRRQAAMRFMRRWLLQKDDNPDELPMTLSSDAELQCTRTGEVLSDFTGGVSAFDLNRMRARELAENRQKFWKQPKPSAIKKVQTLTGFRATTEVPQAALVKTHEADTYGAGPVTIEKLLLQRTDELPLPAVLMKPKLASTGRLPATIILSGAGKAGELDPKGTAQQLLAEGRLILAVDLRGFGETAAGGRSSSSFGTDFKTGLLAIHLNRPLLGQRVEDIVATLNYLLTRSDVNPEQIELLGIGAAGPAALHAAAFDSRVKSVTMKKSIRSWMNVVDSPLGTNQLTNIVPFALESYDLPDLVRSMKPRNVKIVDPVDPTGRTY